VSKKAAWTFMIYLAGDNNLSTAGETDLREMERAGSSENVHVVAEFDRVGEETDTKRYEVRGGCLQEVADLGETDCGDPNLLLDFVAWAADEYPAERYALVLWNHGSGWEPSSIDTIAQEVGTRNYGRAEGAERSASALGRVFFRSTLRRIMALESLDDRAICSDDGTGHALDTVELGKVLELAVERLGQPLDLLGMDACLMSNLEVAYQARDTVRYIVASEESEPFDGWPYDQVLARVVSEPDLAPASLAAHIVDAYLDSYAGTSYTVTQAALDLSEVEALADPLDELADALMAHMPGARFEIWTAQMKPAAKFWHNTLWDIAHFCERLETGTANQSVGRAAREVRDRLVIGPGNFVLAEGHQGEKVERCRGVTVYLKPPPSEISRYYADLDYAAQHRWGHLLETYHSSA
jgi:hypothetical protein